MPIFQPNSTQCNSQYVEEVSKLLGNYFLLCVIRYFVSYVYSVDFVLASKLAMFSTSLFLNIYFLRIVTACSAESAYESSRLGLVIVVNIPALCV